MTEFQAELRRKAEEKGKSVRGASSGKGRIGF
jgi:hypothetical protein